MGGDHREANSNHEGGAAVPFYYSTPLEIHKFPHPARWILSPALQAPRRTGDRTPVQPHFIKGDQVSRSGGPESVRLVAFGSFIFCVGQLRPL